MSPAVNVDLEEVPFAILEAVRARILANRARINDARLRPSTRPRPQFRKTGASNSSWRLPQHGAAAVDDGVALWQVRETQLTAEASPGPFAIGWQGICFTAASDFTIRFVGRAENLAAGPPSRLPIRMFRQLTAPESGTWQHAKILETQLDDRNAQWHAGGYRYVEIEPIEVNKGETYSILAQWKKLADTDNANDAFQETLLDVLDPDDPIFSAAVPSQELVSDIFHCDNRNPELAGTEAPISGQVLGSLYRMTTSFAIDDVDNAKPDWAYIGAPTPVGGRTLPWTGF